jgi:hypothetical protein
MYRGLIELALLGLGAFMQWVSLKEATQLPVICSWWHSSRSVLFIVLAWRSVMRHNNIF